MAPMKPARARRRPPPRAHVIGAGMAGLSAATTLAAQGVRVTLSEAAAQAGGRCRSYFDTQLGLTIDNGAHLVLSGNRAVRTYLERIGASRLLTGPDTADFAFVDLRDGARWRVRPNDGPLPWWVLVSDRRVPRTGPVDYLALAALLARHPGKRIDQVMACEGVLWERLWRPFLLAALNTQPGEASADLAGAVVRESLARGGAASRPRIADPTLAAAFVAPALAFLNVRGARIALGRRLKALEHDGARVTGLAFADGTETVGPGEQVILAVPPGAAQALLPGLSAPDAFRAILNGHFAVRAPIAGSPREQAMMTGVIGGTAEWVFSFHDRVSVTVSAADELIDLDRDVLAARLWRDVVRVLALGDAPLPAWQIVKEKRATFAATPQQDAKRPPARTALANLALAGDWTQTGLPATIEGALRSGEAAAALALAPASPDRQTA
jgi:squalene-associated FAD-dependent desaturase